MQQRAFFWKMTTVAVLGLAACAGPAIYEAAPRPGGPGYTESQIESDRFRVTFNASSGGVQKAEDFARRRAAELTVSRGYDWFLVTERFIEPYASGGRTSLSIGGGFGSFGRRSASSVGVGIPLSGRGGASVSLEVRLGKGQKPNDPQAYDARDILRLSGGGPSGPA
jgi:hypothetical protein